ncbi:MAG: ABC transporter substrate-binding protein [Rhizobiales bacterium]|nr:ABC transporter substrate-binding protein [Hyphomicrobiales bacterium]
MKKLATTSTLLLAATAMWATTGRTSAADDYLIGLIAGTTGAYGSTGIATVNGSQMAVDEINASATLSGQLYEKLLSEGAIVIAGSPDTGPVTAQLAERHKFPTIGIVDDGGLTVNPDGPKGPPNPWVFDFGLNTFAWGEKIGEHALKHCPDGLAVLHDPSTYGQGGLFGIQLAYDKAGQKIAMDHTITENWSTGATAGLMPEVNAIKAAGIKCVDVWLTPQDQAAFVQDLQSIGYEAIVYGNDETNADDTYSSLAGELADGTITAMLTTELHPSAELAAFREAYKSKFGVEATPFSAGAYDSIKMLAQVIGDVKSTKPENLQKGFNAVKDFKGLTGNIGFSEDNHITINADQITLVKYDSKSKTWVEVSD